MPERMTRYLLDANVILDLLGRREPFVDDAVRLFALAEQGRCELWVSPHCLATIYYVISKGKTPMRSARLLEKLVQRLRVAPVDEETVRRTFTYSFRDWEDALVASVAQSARVDAIVTRNVKDFKDSPVPVLLPLEALAHHA